MDLSLILGPAVIAAIITGSVSLYVAKKNSQFQFIVNKENKRCEILREIVSKLADANYNNVLKILVELKSCINYLGLTEKTVDYEKDTHIWKLINEIENTVVQENESKLKKQKKLLIAYIVLLIGYIEENLKEEIKGDIEVIAAYVLCVTSCIVGGVLYILHLYKYGIGVQQTMPVTIVLIIMVLFISWQIAENIPIYYFIKKNGVRKISINNTIVVWTVVFSFYMIIFYMSITKFKSIELLIVIMLYAIGLLCFHFSHAKKVLRIYKYQSAIDNI